MKILKLIRVDFDSMSNRHALSESVEGIWMNDSQHTAVQKMQKHLGKIKVTPYSGWDDKIYPYFKIERENVK